MAVLSNQPPKGTSDWFPEEFAVRKYIFDTWRKVCLQFGYQEYLTPIVESADIYRAKSGEDVGGNELMTMVDRGGRELAIRPEMTPSVTRLVSRVYEATPKPIRYFSIANYLRNEKPQRGRNREFWQLNFDIFGSQSGNADVEILQMAIEIMLAFGANKEQFILRINDRLLIEDMVTDLMQIPSNNLVPAVRLLDKIGKLPESEVVEQLNNLGAKEIDVLKLVQALAGDKAALGTFENWFSSNSNRANVERIMQALTELGYADYIEWNPGLMRGFDYYDGMVFEAFDKHPENQRSLFGGGRYNGLASLFGGNSFPAVGCAPGDETTKLFLESWNLLKNIQNERAETVFIPLLSSELIPVTNKLAQQLRVQGKQVTLGLEEQKLGKALEYAGKSGFTQVVILGTEELERGEYQIKDLDSGTQISQPLT